MRRRFTIVLVALFAVLVVVFYCKHEPQETKTLTPEATSFPTQTPAGDQASETLEVATSAPAGTAPSQSSQVTGAIAGWPYYSDGIIEVPYPPNWYYVVTYSASASSSYGQFADSNHLIETISFWEKTGAAHDSDGAFVEVDENPFSIAEEVSDPELISRNDSFPSTEYRIPNKSYPAFANEIDDGGSEYMADVDMACQDYVMHASIDFIPGEEPSSESSTLALHAMISGLGMRQCE